MADLSRAANEEVKVVQAGVAIGSQEAMKIRQF